MFTKRDKLNQTLITKILVLQLSAVALIAILIFFTVSLRAALAVVAGGGVGYLSNAIYFRIALKPLENMNPNTVVSRFYKGQAFKFISLFALFYLALEITERISQADYLVYLLAGLVVSQLVHAISPVLIRRD